MSVSKDRILYEDDHLLAVNKRSFELVVKGAGKVQKLPLLDYLKQDYPSLQTLHRLDFETSGVVLFAKTKEAFKAMRKEDGVQWEKWYQTLVMGVVERNIGVVRKQLEARGKKTLIDAKSEYEVLDRFGNSTLVEVKITTGRHHQIRKHFAVIGHPLVLDSIYGHQRYNQLFSKEIGLKKFFLHASRMEFVHPVTSEKVSIEAPLPLPFKKVVKFLKSL